MTVPLSSILHYLADVAPRGPANPWQIAPRRADFVSLDDGTLRVDEELRLRPARDPIRWVSRESGLDRLGDLDALHHAERLLRLGWLFLTGTATIEGEERRVFLPLARAPATVDRVGRSRLGVTIESDLELPEGIMQEGDREWAEERLPGLLAAAFHDTLPDPQALVASPEWEAWISHVARSARLPVPVVLPPGTNPLRYDGELAVGLDLAVFLARDVDAPNVAGTLRGWASRDLTGTAFEAVYAPAAAETLPDAGAESPLPLNRGQREAIVRARREPVTVVSGPPGTGKSHLVAAAALSAVGGGNSVLIATQSDYAADVLADLLERYPGPRYVRFGRTQQRESVAGDLSGGMAVPFSPADVSRLQERRRKAVERVEEAGERITRLLEREQALARGLARRDLLAGATAAAPGVTDPGLNWDRVEQLVTRAVADYRLFADFRRNRAKRRLRRLIAAREGASWRDIEEALEAGRAEAAVRRGLDGGGLTLDRAWSELELAEEAWRTEVGRVIETVRRSRSNTRKASTQAVAALASALRAGRVSRRRMLRNLRASQFLDVLPLWLGTLKEIDDTLPIEAGIFDIVIFDEASQIDQMRAAPALARARRAMVVGDPRQLRHVSFVSDQAMEDAARAAEVDSSLARILDVRRNSLFDAAAGAAPVTWLDEHFRSVPHIIGFSDRTFYEGKLRLMTQHPATETRDAIRLVQARGTRNERGMNEPEAEVVCAQVRLAMDAGAESIGVVTPFRAQSLRLEGMLVREFRGDEMRKFGVRVGTVHAYQGNERHVMIVSLALGPEELGQSLRFIEDPNLFNVMVTRARTEMVVVHSFAEDDLPPGMLADYFRYARQPPLPSETSGRPAGWVGSLADALQAHGIPYVAGYPVAGWQVDLAIGRDAAALGVECEVHPEGAAIHIERHLALRRAGWDLTDAFQSRWLAQPEAAIDRLAQEVLRRSAAG